MKHLKLLTLPLAGVLIVACTLTPGAQQRVDELERQLTELTTERDALAAEAADLSAQVDAAEVTAQEAQAALQVALADLASASTPEEREAAQAAVDAATEVANAAAQSSAQAALDAVQELEALVPVFEQAQAAIDGKVAEIAAVEAADIKEQATGASAPFLPLVPQPFQGLAAGALALLPWVASKRSRQHLGKAVRELSPLDGQMAPGEAVESIARALGLSHSSEDPAELLAVLKRKAEADGMVLASHDGKLVLIPAAVADSSTQLS
jgi:hypothetical protein